MWPGENPGEIRWGSRFTARDTIPQHKVIYGASPRNKVCETGLLNGQKRLADRFLICDWLGWAMTAPKALKDPPENLRF